MTNNQSYGLAPIRPSVARATVSVLMATGRDLCARSSDNCTMASVLVANDNPREMGNEGRL